MVWTSVINDWIQNPGNRHAIVYIMGIVAGVVMLLLMLATRKETQKKSILTLAIVVLVAMNFGLSYVILSDWFMDEVIAAKSQEFVNWTNTPIEPQTIIDTMNQVKAADKKLGALSPVHGLVEWYTTPLGPHLVLECPDKNGVYKPCEWDENGNQK
jgi:hypothetical protein